MPNNLALNLKYFNGTPHSASKIILTPSYSPTISSSILGTGDSVVAYTDATGSLLDAVLPATYKINVINGNPATVFYADVNATSSILSGSAITGSSKIVTFNLDYLTLDKFVNRVKITPYNNNVVSVFSGSVYTLDSINYYTDNNGAFSSSMIPGNYIVECYNSGSVTTKFNINVPSVGGTNINATACVVDKNCNTISIPLNTYDKSYALSVSASDQRYYLRGELACLSAYDTGSYNVTNTNAVYSMSYSTTYFTVDGLSISGSDRSNIKVNNSGVYNIQYSAQFANADTADQDIQIWLRKNNVDVDYSNTIITAHQKHGLIAGRTVPAWNWIVSASANDSYKICYQAASTNISLLSYGAGTNPTTPAVPAVILTVNKIA